MRLHARARARGGVLITARLHKEYPRRGAASSARCNANIINARACARARGAAGSLEIYRRLLNTTCGIDRTRCLPSAARDARRIDRSDEGEREGEVRARKKRCHRGMCAPRPTRSRGITPRRAGEQGQGQEEEDEGGRLGVERTRRVRRTWLGRVPSQRATRATISPAITTGRDDSLRREIRSPLPLPDAPLVRKSLVDEEMPVAWTLGRISRRSYGSHVALPLTIGRVAPLNEPCLEEMSGDCSTNTTDWSRYMLKREREGGGRLETREGSREGIEASSKPRFA